MAIFANPYSGNSDVWSPHTASIQISGQSSSPDFIGAITGVTIEHSRAELPQYPIGTDQKPIKLVGVPTGTLQFNYIVGPTTQLQSFLKKFGDPCQTFTITLKINSKNLNNKLKCNKTIKQQTIKLTDVSGSSLNFSLTSGQGGISQAGGAFRMSFTEMDWS